jgi:hypothetical protein
MRRRCLIAIMVTVLFTVVGVHLRSLDGLQGHLLGFLLETDTEYAPDYTDSAFRLIETLQTKNQVLTLLGEPFARNLNRSGSGERWMYSRSPGSTHFRCREVSFTDGLVTGKRHHFYID